MVTRDLIKNNEQEEEEEKKKENSTIHNSAYHDAESSN